MDWHSLALPVSHGGSPLPWRHLCSQADVGDGMRESSISPCPVAGASPDLPATRAAGSEQCQGSRCCHRPGAPLSHPARSQAPARGRTGTLPHPGAGSQLTWFAWLGTASPECWAMPFPLHLRLRAVQGLRWSQTGPAPLEVPVALPGASLALHQGAVRCSGARGCLVGPLSPQLPEGLWRTCFSPSPCKAAPCPAPGTGACVEGCSTGATGVPGEGQLEASGERRV